MYASGSVIAAAAIDRMMLFQIAGITPEASVTSRQLASVHVLVSKLPVQNRESETIPSAMSGRRGATTPYRKISTAESHEPRATGRNPPLPPCVTKRELSPR